MNTPNRTVYSTSTDQANMRKTGKSGMLRVAAATFPCNHDPEDFGIREASSRCVRHAGHTGDHRDKSGGEWQQ